MDIVNALNIFGYTSIDELKSAEDVRNKFRKLMRKYHPDLCQGDKEKEAEFTKLSKDINEAHDLLKVILKELANLAEFEKLTAKQVEIFAIIPFEKLLNLYNGDVIKLGERNKDIGEAFTLTSANIRSHRIILCVTCSIKYYGVEHNYIKLVPWVLRDEYTIDCDITVLDDTPIDVEICAYNKNISIALKNNSTKLRLRYEHGVNLDININKRYIKENSVNDT